ncbi:MAG: ABC transporter permease, partial [Clostridia bacterium]|nr:ABC transporter permease [Clostridia bacterium]
MSNEHILYLKKLKRKRTLIVAVRILLFVFIIALWEIAGRVGLCDPFIVSSPARVCRTIANLYSQNDLFPHILTTFFETVAGFAAGTALGVLIAVLLWFCPFLER